MFSQSSAINVESLEGRTMFAAPTDLDPSFSGDGKTITDFGGANDVAHAVAVQSNGRIVVAGETQVTVNGVKKTAFAVVRYNADGSLDDGGTKDTTKGDKFGTAGKYTRVVDRGGGTGALAVAIQNDGRIILGGNAIKSAAAGSQWYFLRLNKNGTLDSGFGTSGVQSTSFVSSINPQFKAMVLQPSGKLLIAGSAEGDWIVRRLLTNGKFDTGFNSNGTIGADFGGDDIATAITLDRLGNIVVAGNIMAGEVAVARYFSEGARDLSFGVNGRKVFEPPTTFTECGAVAALPNGEVVVAYSGQASASGLTSSTIPVGGTAVFDNNGNYVGSGYSGGLISANGLLNTPTDFFAIGGTTVRNGPEQFYFAKESGVPANFVGFGSSADHNVASAMTIGKDGKIVQVGYTTAGGGGRNFAIARYVGTPTKNLGAITGNVFYDADKDSVRDVNEGPDLSARVYIDGDNNGIWNPDTERSALVDNSGNYKFIVAPGTYRIRQVLDYPYSQTLPTGAPGAYLATVGSKQTVGGINFGRTIFTVHGSATRIVGSVFFDFDGDGFRDVQNPTEPDLVGRTVFVDINGNGIPDAGESTTITDGGGNYKFEGIAPGNYRIGDILPAGWTHTDPSSGFWDVSVAANQTVARSFATTFADDDDTLTEVNAKPSNQISVGGAVNFSIGNVTDVDLVRFTAKKGQRIGFDLDRASGTSLNSFLRLFDANGNQLAINDDAAAPGETKASDSYLAFTFNAAGSFCIGVSNSANKAYEPRFGYGDNGAGTTGGYKLSLVNIPQLAFASSTGIGSSSTIQKHDVGDASRPSALLD